DTVRVIVAASRTPKFGRASETIAREHDDCWVALQAELHWTYEKGKRAGFLWLSEREGWRHIYKVDGKSKSPSLITAGDFDVIAIAGIDRKSGQVYFTASPDNATEKY